MKEVVLKPKSQPAVGLEAEVITPDNFAGKSIEEIKALLVFEGKLERKLSDFFEISGEAGTSSNETSILIDGSVERTKRIGQEMKGGEIVIRGDVGMHIGSKMRGGKITVMGNADAFGAEGEGFAAA
jgi:formylmethanofuran dehydrogenase subunit C